MKRVITRRRLLFSAPVVLAGAAWPFAEAMELELCRKDVKLNRPILSRPVRILHLSDFHVSRVVPFRLIERAIEMGVSEHPDLICLTGDFVTIHNPPVDVTRYERILRRLSGAAPAFACFGNHDGGLWTASQNGARDCSHVMQMVAAAGIRPLHNRADTISVRQQRLRLFGVGDLWSWDARPEDSFADADVCTIALAHNPDTKTVIRDLPWDLMLSGHTHGGQVVLPLIGPAYAPVVDMRFIAGVYEWEGRHIHITRGVGNIKGIRVNCRPEVSVLTVS